MMKRIVISICIFISVVSLFAQNGGFSYQGVVRDSNNRLVSNRTVGVRMSLLRDFPNGVGEYIETHTVQTNDNGLIVLMIGNGNVVSGSMVGIDWLNHVYYLKSEFDINGGTNYTISGTRLVSGVPYAQNAATANYVETQVISISNDTISLTGDTNSFVRFPIINVHVPDSVSSFINDAGFITKDSIPANISFFNNDAGYITSYIDSQQLGIFGDTLKLERGGQVIIPMSCCSLAYVVNSTTDSLLGVMDSLKELGSILETIVCRPKVVTDEVTAISTDSSVCGGTVASPCGYVITGRGVCWNNTGSATLADNHTSDGAGTGNFVSSLTGLSPNTTYYVRAYAISGNDTVYGADKVFATKPLCVNFFDETSDTVLFCGGIGSYFWRNKSLTASGVYYDSLKTSVGGCDSVYKLNLIVYSAPTYLFTDAQSVSFCGGVGTYLWRGKSLTTSGVYYDSLTTVNTGCDSVYQLALTVNSAPTYLFTDAQSVSFCGGVGVYPWRGKSLTASGVYYDSLTTVNTGCDSVYQLALTVNVAQSYLFTDVQAISASCGDMGSYSWRGRTLTTSGVYYDSLTTKNTGCDSVYQLTLTISGLTLTDYDGNVYSTIQIGSQCWMKENLKTRHYANGGTIIPLGGGTSTSAPYCYRPGYNDTTIAKYGLLYNWKAVMGSSSSNNSNPSTVQGICPNGWHVPSDAEWTQLTDYLSSQSQYWCGANSTYISKSLASTIGWTSTSTITCAVNNDFSGNNTSGFNALPAGILKANFGYQDRFGTRAVFWSCTDRNGTDAYDRRLECNQAYVDSFGATKAYGYSVRCIKN